MLISLISADNLTTCDIIGITNSELIGNFASRLAKISIILLTRFISGGSVRGAWDKRLSTPLAIHACLELVVF